MRYPRTGSSLLWLWFWTDNKVWSYSFTVKTCNTTSDQSFASFPRLRTLRANASTCVYHQYLLWLECCKLTKPLNESNNLWPVDPNFSLLQYDEKYLFQSLKLESFENQWGSLQTKVPEWSSTWRSILQRVGALMARTILLRKQSITKKNINIFVIFSKTIGSILIFNISKWPCSQSANFETFY